jgi:hypothetical protein
MTITKGARMATTSETNELLDQESRFWNAMKEKDARAASLWPGSTRLTCLRHQATGRLAMSPARAVTHTGALSMSPFQ